MSTALTRLLFIIGVIFFLSLPFKAHAETDVYEFSDSGHIQYRADHLKDKVVDNRLELEWYGVGGNINLGLDYIKSIWELQDKGVEVVLNVTDGAYSMHAFVACQVDRVNIAPGGYLMFHAVGKLDSKGRYTIDRGPEATEATLLFLQPCVAKGILTQQQVDSIVKDRQEVYVYYVNHK